MIPLIILAFVPLAFLLFLFWQVWRRHFDRDKGGAGWQLTPVDLDAFENLTDPEEEQFLRANLSPREFRDVQRSRIRAARMYVMALSENAGMLVAAGQSARSSSDPEIAAAGIEVVQRAIRLKVWCLLSLLRLDAAVAFPAIMSPSSKIANQYLLATYRAANLPGKVSA